MFKKINDFKKDAFVRGSLALFIMINIFNFLNYFFHFSMARLLGPADYGILTVLMSFVYIFYIPSEAIQTIVTKYVSRLNIKNESGKIKDLTYRSLKKGFRYSIFLFLLFLPFAFFLSIFLNIDFLLLIITSTILFYVFSISIMRGVLQGKKKFTWLGINMIIESLFKVLLAIAFVLVGWKVYGAIGGLLMASLIALFSIFFAINEILISKKEKTDFNEAYSYGIPVLIATISIVLFYSLDIILVKGFFTDELAGKYAVASMLGKIIFFGTSAIGKTMFPLTSEIHEKGKDPLKILIRALEIVSILSVIALIIYLFFPKLIIGVLFGPEYVSISNILFIIGLAFTFLSISYVIILYNLSINKTKKLSVILPSFVILLIVLLSIFHSSLIQFSIIVLIINFLVFIYSLFLLKK
ncbi:MAG: oligosaccharide flippase family protein [Candidatus Nanoarchaeia archaeon]|nr:oligosaccharide flippase family protein [Candidatus Nanoarchaeia archaeon]MDD5741418.1 oligosaccharide flippase family protein [Candidatus Nanoarchaeia archaeon]